MAGRMTAKAASHWGSSRYGKIFYQCCKVLARVILSLWTRPTIEGRQSLAVQGPLLILSTHQSNFDYLYIGLASRRKLRAVLKQELFYRFPLFFALGGAIPIARGQRDISGIKASVGILDASEVLLVFAEGTRNPGQRVSTINQGIRTYLREGTKVVFVGLAGTESFRWGARPVLFVSECYDVDALPKGAHLATTIRDHLQRMQNNAWREFNRRHKLAGRTQLA